MKRSIVVTLLSVLAVAAVIRQSHAQRRGAEHPGAIESTDQPVTAETPLKIDDVLQVQWGGRWWAARVLSLEADGKVKVHFIGWEKRWEEIVPRSRLQLDPRAEEKAMASRGGRTDTGGTARRKPVAQGATAAEVQEHYAGVDDETRGFIENSNRGFAKSGLWIPHSAIEALPPEQLTQKLDGWLKTIEGPVGRNQCQAIEALGAARCKEAVPRLLEIATDPNQRDNRTRWLATRALGRITGRVGVEDMLDIIFPNFCIGK